MKTRRLQSVLHNEDVAFWHSAAGKGIGRSLQREATLEQRYYGWLWPACAVACLCPACLWAAQALLAVCRAAVECTELFLRCTAVCCTVLQRSPACALPGPCLGTACACSVACLSQSPRQACPVFELLRPCLCVAVPRALPLGCLGPACVLLLPCGSTVPPDGAYMRPAAVHKRALAQP